MPYTGTYSEPCQTSMIKLFANIVNSFAQKALSQMFDKVLSTPLVHDFISNFRFYLKGSRGHVIKQNELWKCLEIVSSGEG